MTLSRFFIGLAQLVALGTVAVAAAKWIYKQLTFENILVMSGPLGLAVSILTFALMCRGRRARINVLMILTAQDEHAVDSRGTESQVVITITNLWSKPIQLDLRTLELRRTGFSFRPCTEVTGGDEFERPTLAPSGHCKVSLAYRSFLESLNIQPPEQHNEKTFYKDAAVELSIKTTNGRLFSSDNNRYEEDTGRFVYR